MYRPFCQALRGGEKMNIGLVDSDLLDKGTKFPNLALMKLSAYFKQKGSKTRLINYSQINNFDRVYISKVFDYTKTPDLSKFKTDIIKGGTGFYFDKAPPLEDKIEHHKPDYSLYEPFVKEKIKERQIKSKWKYYLDYDIGFTTRGCFRQCSFCINRNKNKVCKHSQVNEFVTKSNKYITLLDDNILGFGGWRGILEKLMSTGKYFEYKQGMDMRLMTEEKAKILNEAKYHGDYIFAFDNLDDKTKLIPKIKVWNKYKSKQTKFYVLVGFHESGYKDVFNMFERIKILMKLGCIPYIMRHKKYKKSNYKGLYTSVARWVNQTSLFKKMSFKEFCLKDNESTKSKCASLRRAENFMKEFPIKSKEYFNMKYEKRGEII